MAFARTQEYEELFARGYPHLRRLVTPHADEAAAEQRAESALDEGDPGRYHVDWPAEVAYRYVRALCTLGEFGIGFSARRKAGLTKAADAGIRKAGPVDEAEGRKLVAGLLAKDHSHYQFQVERGVFLLEAMIGTAALVDAVLGTFEKAKDLEGKYSTSNNVAYALGFAIRRLPAKQRTAAEARVTKLVATKPASYTRDFLSYLVGGRKALEDSGRKLGLYCVHFCDDPALIRELAKQSVAYVDASHVYLAGDAVLDAIPKGVRKIDKHRKKWLYEELAVIASKKVAAVLKAIGAPKPAKAAKRPSDAAIEKRFEALSAWLAEELGKARGKRAKETKLLDEAVQRYADIRNDIGEPPTEAVVHFFGADGCGWKKHRTPALQRIDPTDAELARWTSQLGKA